MAGNRLLQQREKFTTSITRTRPHPGWTHDLSHVMVSLPWTEIVSVKVCCID